MLPALILAALTASAAAPNPADVPYQVVKMPFSRSKAGVAHARAQSKWNSLWAADEIKACGHANPPPPPPTIDWTKNEVVGIFLGAGSSGRKDPEIVSVRQDAHQVTVSYRDRSMLKKSRTPDEAGAVRGVVTCPQIVIKLPLTSKRVHLKRVR